MRLRRSELFYCVFLLYAMVMGVSRPIDLGYKQLLVLLNPALMGWFFLLAWADRFRQPSYLGMVRDWLMYPLILLAFREMGWLALENKSRAFENAAIGWDRWLLYDAGLKAGVESLGLVGPVVLECAYLLVYAVPGIALFRLYRHGRRDLTDDFYSMLLFGTLTAYALFPWFPSDPPRTFFAGQDLPPDTLVRQLNLFLVGGYGIKTSVFPSGHTAMAFSAAFALMRLLPEKPWVGRRLLVLAVLIAVATVYGRYHFAVDTAAGLALAVLAWGLSYRLRPSAGRSVTVAVQ